MLQALIGPIANLASGYLSNKHEQAQAKHQAKTTGDTKRCRLGIKDGGSFSQFLER